ncbi:MAG: hypothetical protein QM537_05630 [Candidatus Symbiobacter sp.]|nr:hypothetical protein [Candidatus Symbiobacter sp.]
MPRIIPIENKRYTENVNDLIKNHKKRFLPSLNEFLQLLESGKIEGSKYKVRRAEFIHYQPGKPLSACKVNIIDEVILFFDTIQVVNAQSEIEIHVILISIGTKESLGLTIRPNFPLSSPSGLGMV